MGIDRFCIENVVGHFGKSKILTFIIDTFVNYKTEKRGISVRLKNMKIWKTRSEIRYVTDFSSSGLRDHLLSLVTLEDRMFREIILRKIIYFLLENIRTIPQKTNILFSS